MTIRDDADLKGLSRAGRAVAVTLEEMKARLRPGMTTRELDRIGAEVLARFGAVPAPAKLYRFPGTTCISVNDEVAHGIPSGRVLREGDLVNLDVSAELGGYFADTGYTLLVGEGAPALADLCACSRRALGKALAVARTGVPVRHVGAAIEREARAAGYTVLRNLTGHGVGRRLHEDPNIPGWADPTERARLQRGMVVAIETFVADGGEFAVDGEDGWTLYADDGGFAAQYEHTVVITDGEPIVLTKA